MSIRGETKQRGRANTWGHANTTMFLSRVREVIGFRAKVKPKKATPHQSYAKEIEGFGAYTLQFV